jgi:hypothetical protein
MNCCTANWGLTILSKPVDMDIALKSIIWVGGNPNDFGFTKALVIPMPIL